MHLAAGTTQLLGAVFGHLVVRYRDIKNLPALMHPCFGSIQARPARAVPRQGMVYDDVSVIHPFERFAPMAGLSTCLLSTGHAK
jgi:hypothetical protein